MYILEGHDNALVMLIDLTLAAQLSYYTQASTAEITKAGISTSCTLLM